MMIEELEDNALQELKRADHLIYVTLKYTRTVDVIKSIIKRLINAYDFAINAGLEVMDVKPDIIRRQRIVQFSKYLRDIKPDVKFYLMLRQIDQASYEKKEEYRKNVALITRFGEVNIAMLVIYFERTKEFVVAVEDFIRRHKGLLVKREKRKVREKKEAAKKKAKKKKR